METENGKLFVGGVSQETGEETLIDYFGKYGEIKECEILRDRATGKGRGFGFVTFTDQSVADEVLKHEHIILGRKVEVKLAIPKGEMYHNQCPNQQNNNGSCRNNSNGNCNRPWSTKKIFIGGLPSKLTEEELKGYFERFGAITDAIVMYDKENDRSRGFGFVTFDSEEAVDIALQQKYHTLNGRAVEVKRAEPKDRNKGHICIYNCNDLGHHFERLSGSSSSGLHHDFVTSYNISPSGMLPYGSFMGYYYGANPYGAGYLAGPSNGLGYETFSGTGASNSHWNQISYENPVGYPSYINGGVYCNGWTIGLVDVTNGNGGSHASAPYIANKNCCNETDGDGAAEVSSRVTSGPVDVTNNGVSHACANKNFCNEINGDGDAEVSSRATSGQVDVSNGNGGSHASAMPVANKNCCNGDGDAEVSSCVILQPALPETDDALPAESNGKEHQKETDCQSTPDKSS
ncbi:Heterogeneous nuclear ribonucleoprotein like [Actinidia chinensis var. chinensis]|uniref:Heterogeneous nuclear ribonucleoprotein like n=1 Tax=Actinidia chinensis var. chinensis TaxID=1590841 RepID=A0A2R6R5C8_ACTCC|nr:Heterogeneous nuclear ribonucleoprotein like [Actinidia chinensis var. chinensis]